MRKKRKSVKKRLSTSAIGVLTREELEEKYIWAVDAREATDKENYELKAQLSRLRNAARSLATAVLS